jgi:hypothetical protein
MFPDDALVSVLKIQHHLRQLTGSRSAQIYELL